MPGLVPGIHVFGPDLKKDVDGRDKPGHDEKYRHLPRTTKAKAFIAAANPTRPARSRSACR
ncbi:hypothetical protein XI02_33725 [Bradyrhizobium sp. CCBAU 21365]|nr:hypothetical protein XI02_33725 [Bradyrhizobium sp. CCBAU 21365]